MLRIALGRPLARLVVRAAGASPPTSPAGQVPSYSPPIPVRAPPVEAVPDEPERAQAQIALLMLHGLLGMLPEDADLPASRSAMAPDVVVWSPTLHATSSEEVIAAFEPKGDLDNALTDAQLRILASDDVGDRVYIEWWLTARFTNPCFIDDDLLVEPTGRLVEASGVQVATFRAGRLTRVNCYYDDLALLEQIVT